MTNQRTDASGDLTATATVFEMVDRLALLKEQEDNLRARRWAIEAALVEALQFQQVLARQGKNSGSKTFNVEDTEGSKLKVQLTQSFSHKLDAATLKEVAQVFEAEGVMLPVRMKPEPIMAQLDGLQAMHPSLWKTFQRALTSTPNKVGVTVVKN